MRAPWVAQAVADDAQLDARGPPGRARRRQHGDPPPQLARGASPPLLLSAAASPAAGLHARASITPSCTPLPRWPCARERTQVEGRAITPGQTLYLRCPAVSLLQSHPFSVADVVHTDGGAAHAVVHVMAQGPWTRAVCAKLAQGETLRLQVRVCVCVRWRSSAASRPSCGVQAERFRGVFCVACRLRGRTPLSSTTTRRPPRT